MAAKGIKQVVVSPGSRNAPAIILFNANKQLQLLSVADERSAGFFALGLALHARKPVAILCTSGSAVLNYAPAIAEAYYQKVPLLVLTTDRPPALIDQGDGQTIRQQHVFGNYIRKSFNLPVEITDKQSGWYFDRIVNEAIDRTLFPVNGPVQINIPLDEPLYDLEPITPLQEVKVIDYLAPELRISKNRMQELTAAWSAAASKLVIVGQMHPDPEMNRLLALLSQDPTVAILTETTTNMHGENFISCIDRTLAQIPLSRNAEYTPDILVSLGGAIISKKIKALVRSISPKQTWSITADPEEFHYDTYKSLSMTIAMDAKAFIGQLVESVLPAETSAEAIPYAALWKESYTVSLQKHPDAIKALPFSDMVAYREIFGSMPKDTAVHPGNSTPVRYAQLYDFDDSVTFYSNRGVSGIDGCSSTAAGFAYNFKGITLLLTGDVSFFYDSNALWNNNLHERLKIIMLNNGGGNIFRVIDGPTEHEELEPFIETNHTLQAQGICSNFNIHYFKASSLTELSALLPVFFADPGDHRPALLEVITDNKTSAKALKDYFSMLRK